MPKLVLFAQATPTGIRLTWTDGPAAFPAYEVPAKALATAAETARQVLGTVVGCVFSSESGDLPSATASLATAGYGLYQALFKPPAEQQHQASEIRKWLDKLHGEQAIESLEVVTDGVDAVPWNLVYDRRPDPKAFQLGGEAARWEPFWGLRYDLSCGRRVSPLRRFPILENPRVLVVTDPAVTAGLPAEAQELRALCREYGWGHAESRTELATALQNGRPELLYWLGHTQVDPFGLVLGEETITPEELRVLLEGDSLDARGEVFGGIAFLNACGTAQIEKSSSFLDALHPLGLSGLIATEQVTIDTFAAPLGLEFLRAFIVGGKPLGKIMRHLRARVPLGLLYGSYCPPTIRVRLPGEDQTPTSGVILATPVRAGTKLRRSSEDVSPQLSLPAHPYRSLQSYSAEDRPLFTGRDDDIVRFAQLLDEPGTRLLILHGESGVGKTSFLRAGVIPFLENDCAGYRFARDRSKGESGAVLLIRATNDPVSQIATALSAHCATPFTYRTPEGEEIRADLPATLQSVLGDRTGPDALRDALRADPGALGRVLAALARMLPFTPLLVIDQAEEVFTLARTPADEANRTIAMEMLRRAANEATGFKIVVSLRTEYHGRWIDRLRKGTRDASGVRDYLLTDFGLDALIEVIRRPTAKTPLPGSAEVPAEKYRFQYAEGVAEEIARRTRAYTINRQDSVLPLVQVVCSQLYDRVKVRPDGVIRLSDLEAIGGVEGGMRAHTESVVWRLFPRRGDQKAFKRLLADSKTQLFIRQPDGTLTTALLPATFLAKHWKGRTPFEEVLGIAGDGDWRLLRVNSLRIGADEAEQPYVSLGHDALAKVVAGWAEDRKRWAQLRKYVIALSGLFALCAVLGVLTGRALRAQEDARTALKLAEDFATNADEARAIANRDRADAITAKNTADAERDRADAERDKAERQRYIATARLADLEWANGNYAASVELLEKYHPTVFPPKPGRDFPGFEWHYQWRRSKLVLPALAGGGGKVQAAFTPDGSRIITSANDLEALVWDVRTGHRVMNLRVDSQDTYWATLSPDGARIVTSSAEHFATVWDFSARWTALDLKGNAERPVRLTAWNATGTRLLTAGDSKASVWDVVAGKHLTEFELKDPLLVALSPDGTTITTVDQAQSVQVISTKTGAVLFNLDGHKDDVLAMSFSRDGTRIVTTAGEKVYLWDARSGKLVHTLHTPEVGFVSHASLSPDGTRALILSLGGSVTVWDTSTGQKLSTATGHANGANTAAFNADGSRFVTGGGDKLVKVWDTKTGKELNTFRGHRDRVESVAFSANGARVISVEGSGLTRVWDITAPEAGLPLAVAVDQPGTDIPDHGAVSPDGRTAAVGVTKTVQLLDTATGAKLHTLTGHKELVRSVTFSPDGKSVLTASQDNTAKLWDAATGKELHSLTGHTQFVVFAAFSRDSRWVVTTSCDERAKVWNATTGKEVCSLEGHTGFVMGAVFSPDGSQVATRSEDRSVKLWNAKTGKVLGTPISGVLTHSAVFSPDGTSLMVVTWEGVEIHSTPPGIGSRKWKVPSCVRGAFSAEGATVATTTSAGLVQVWNTQTGAEIAVLPRQHTAVMALSLNPDGTRMLTATSDGAVKVWETRTGAELLTLTGKDNFSAYGATFSPDGTRVLAWFLGASVWVWDGRPIQP